MKRSLKHDLIKQYHNCILTHKHMAYKKIYISEQNVEEEPQ